MPKRTYTISRSSKSLVALLFAAVFLAICACFPPFIESAYSNGLYPVLAEHMQRLFGSIPFSVGDILYCLLLAAGLQMIIRSLIHLFGGKFDQAGRLLLQGFHIFLIAVLLFYLSWGLNYFRRPAAVRFGLNTTRCELPEVKQITLMMIDSANHYRSAIGKRGLKIAKKDLYEAAARAMKALPGDDRKFRTYEPAIKPSLLSGVANYLGTAGYYNPLTSESQINHQMPAFSKPFTACHELSHQMGLASEDEASFMGFLACVNSPDTLFRYSAYYSALGEYLFELRQSDTTAFREMREKLLPAVRRDFRREQRYWMSFHGRAGELSSIFYDQYLKFNRQPKGLQTYNELVRLLTAWYRKKKSWSVH